MIDRDDMSAEEITAGYRLEDGAYICLLCGAKFEQGEVFLIDWRFFEASRAIREHVEKEHPDRFTELINNKYVSLTENQKELFALFHSGLSDREIAKRLGVAASTVRHQKFVFRERAKAAKYYLAAWSLVEENKNRQAGLLPVHEGAVMVDERYVITEEECKKVEANVFESLEPLKLKVFPAKEKKKIVVLRKLAEQFITERKYTEKEVNEILGAIYEDFATLRRYLIEYGYMERTPDCKQYWKK